MFNDIIKKIKLFEKILQISKSKSEIIVPYKMNFDLTYRCYFKCKTCQIWKKNFFYQKEKSKELTLNDYKSIFENCSNDLFVVSFEGGEPFIKEDFDQIVISCLDSCKKLIQVLVATNGYETQKIMDFIQTIEPHLKDQILYMSLSVDGPKDIHNEIRGVKDSFEHIQEIYQSIKSLKNKKIQPILQTTISPYNIDCFHEDFIEKNEVKVLTYYHQNRFFNNETDYAIHEVQKQKIIKNIKQFMKKKRQIGLVNLLNRSYLNHLINHLNNESTLHCFAGFATLSIDPYGEVHPCVFNDQFFGNIKDFNYRFDYLLNFDQAKMVREKLKKEPCQQCFMNCDAIPSILHHHVKKSFGRIMKL